MRSRRLMQPAARSKGDRRLIRAEEVSECVRSRESAFKVAATSPLKFSAAHYSSSLLSYVRLSVLLCSHSVTATEFLNTLGGRISQHIWRLPRWQRRNSISVGHKEMANKKQSLCTDKQFCFWPKSILSWNHIISNISG